MTEASNTIEPLRERLRAVASVLRMDRPYAADAAGHAADLTSQAEEIERLREALKPFANMLPDSYSTKDALQARLQEWCRAARTALNGAQP